MSGETERTAPSDFRSALFNDKLKEATGNLLSAVSERALSAVGSTAGRLNEYADGGGGGLSAAVTGASKLAEGKSPMRAVMSGGAAALKNGVGGLFAGGGGGDGKGGKGGRGGGLKVTNIVESIDVGVPLRLAYDQWTQFRDFPSFTKKVESVDQEADEKLNWRAQIFLSHREWESTIKEQIPDTRIIWTSKGSKGHVDGTVSFHELAPNLTRILLGLEYYPQGFFEQTGNMWRAPGRRARLELKHFRRHMMSHALLDQDSIEGWRGTIQDGEVVKDDETARKEEAEQQQERQSSGDSSGTDRGRRQYAEDEEGEYDADEDRYEDEADEQDQYEDEDETDDQDRYEDDDETDDQDRYEDDDEADDQDRYEEDEDEHDHEDKYDDNDEYDEEDQDRHGGARERQQAGIPDQRRPVQRRRRPQRQPASHRR